MLQAPRESRKLTPTPGGCLRGTVYLGMPEHYLDPSTLGHAAFHFRTSREEIPRWKCGDTRK